MHDFPEMSRIFEGFSEEDIAKVQSEGHVKHSNDRIISIESNESASKRKVSKIGFKQKNPIQTKMKHTSIASEPENSHENLRNNERLSNGVSEDKSMFVTNNVGSHENQEDQQSNPDVISQNVDVELSGQSDIVESSEIGDGVPDNSAKLLELQIKQRLMEEQNRRRKDMLSKALADRTRQTAEEVLKLEKIKKELQVLDGQFSNDVALLRKKIDHASLTYADAEKNYLKVEKEFLAAKINLQKEKEKKELLSEHLCALITHNETHKARKLETLMLQLTVNEDTTVDTSTAADTNEAADNKMAETENLTGHEKDTKESVFAVCEKTGKIVMESSD